MARPNQKLCIFTIGYQDFLMTMVDGTKVMSLLSDVAAVKIYHGSRTKRWIVDPDQPRLHLEAVKADDIDIQEDVRRRPFLLQKPSGV